MNSQELKIAQHAQLIIAREIKRICEKNGINYSLAFGTLLGAIRHMGFIPWDDDLDIAMPRKDYEKFIDCCASDLSPDFFLQTMETDPNYSWPFLKVRLNGTHFKSEWDNNIEHDGVWVDIFPVEQAPPKVITQKVMSFKYKYYLRMLHIKNGVTGYLEHGIAKKTLRRFLKERGKKYSSNDIATKVVAICTRYSNLHNYQSSYVFVTDALYNRIPSSVFQNYIDVDFEDEQFKVVKDYEIWLRQEYGDYMQLPPIEQRDNQHNIAQFCIPKELLDRLENSNNDT